MFGFFDLVLSLASLFEIADVSTREDNQTAVQSALAIGLIVVLAILLADWTPPFEPHALAVAALAALLAAAGLGAVSLLHAIRPLGEDLPRRTWSDSYRRCIGPLCLTLLGGAITLASLHVEAWHSDIGVVVGVILGGAATLLGAAMAVHGARRPF